MLQYLYTLDYDADLTDNLSCGSWLQELEMQATLYGIGEKYGIKGLKMIAQEKSITLLSHCTWQEDTSNFIEHFATVLGIFYTTTPHSDTGLRERILNYSRRKLKIMLEIETFKEVLALLPDLA